MFAVDGTLIAETFDPGGPSDWFTGCDWSPDGSVVAVTSEDRKVRLLDPRMALRETARCELKERSSWIGFLTDGLVLLKSQTGFRVLEVPSLEPAAADLGELARLEHAAAIALSSQRTLLAVAHGVPPSDRSTEAAVQSVVDLFVVTTTLGRAR